MLPNFQSVDKDKEMIMRKNKRVHSCKYKQKVPAKKILTKEQVID